MQSHVQTNTMSAITVIGGTLIDIVTAGGTTTETPGGSPLNVAITLGRLGDNVRLATALAADARRQRIIDHLRASHVAVHLESQVLRETPTAIATIQSNGSADYEFNIEWSISDLDLDGSTWVHSGSLGIFLEPGATHVSRALIRVATPRSFLSTPISDHCS
jgi:fructokinase